MTWTKLTFIMLVASIGSAALIGLISRTPAAVRTQKTELEARDPSFGAEFTDEQVARHGAFRKPQYLSFFLSTALTLLMLVLLSRGPFASLADRTAAWKGGWLTQAVVLGAAITAILAIVGLPLSYVTGYVIQHAWDLSNQSIGAWLSDQLRFLVLGAVISAVTAAAFYGVVRWKPESWWLWGWGAFTLLTVALVFLYPLVITPLFNRFTPLEDSPLRDKVLALGDEAGVPLDEVLVADASKRSSVENAYVAGIGASKQMVLYDTLLEAGTEEETLFVVAHELGHKTENHLVKNIVISSAGLLIGFGALFLLSRKVSIWGWAGAEGVGDPGALPLLILFLTVATLLTGPISSGISRHFERQSDEVAVALTDDPGAGVKTFRRLAFNNLADLRPPQAVVTFLFSHPPIPERIRSLLASE